MGDKGDLSEDCILFAGAFSFASSDAVDAASLTTVGEIRFFGLS